MWYNILNRGYGRSMTEREWSVEEIIESLRQWDSDFYSDSETKWLMSKAADALTAQSESCDGVQVERCIRVR